MAEDTAATIATPRIRRLPPIAPTNPPARTGAPGAIRKLHLNETPFPPAVGVIAAMQAAAATLHRYPDNDGRELISALSAHTGVSADCIVVGAGSNELLFASAEIMLDPGDEAVAPEPGFSSYARSIATRGGVMTGVRVRSDGIVDVDAMLAAIGPNTRLVFIASPHNPTGGALTSAELETLVCSVPDHVLLHLDEAYYEFGRHAGGAETLPILARRRGPWIATRSFSKAYGLAGARVGYGLTSSPELAVLYRNVRIGFSIGAVALAGARAALGETRYVAELLEHNRRERMRLSAALRVLGYVPLESAANFLTILVPLGFPRSASAIATELADRNILVMPFQWPASQGAVRITIGTIEDTDDVIAALSQIQHQ